MPSLLDIAPPELSAEEVDIRGTPLKVTGIPAEQWAALYARFPALRAIVTGQIDGLEALEIFRAQAGLIAAALGSIGDAEIERAAIDRLSAEELKSIVDVAMRLSQPGQILGPLLAEGGAGAADPGKAPATN